MGANGPETVMLARLLAKGRKVVLFALPGAFTGACTHRACAELHPHRGEVPRQGRGRDLCLAVNDPFVLKAWGEATGANKAGITMLGDADGRADQADRAWPSPTRPWGSTAARTATRVVIEDGVVTRVQIDKPGECNISTGEALLETI